jgi:hypothetical protein
LSWSTTGATQTYIWGASDDAGVTRIGFVTPTASGFKDVVTGWGTRSFILGAKDAAGTWTYKRVSTPVANAPTPVTITSTNPVIINYFRGPSINSPLPNHTITWNNNGASLVKMRRCVLGGSCVNLPDTTGTSYVVNGNDLASVNPASASETFGGLLAPSGQGQVVYELTACTTRPDSSLYCGESVKATIRVVPSLSTSTWRAYRNHPVWLGHTVSWQANGGNWFYVDAPTLGVFNFLTTSTSYDFTAAQLNNAGPGLHTIKIKSCRWYGGPTIDCAWLHSVRAKTAGTVTDLITGPGSQVNPANSVFPIPIAKVNGVTHTSSRGGRLHTTCGCNGQNVAAGTVLATIETNDYSLVQLHLGSSQTWTTKPWSQDFSSGEVIQANTLKDVRPGGGFTVNGTTILPNGDIYALGEFTTSAVYVAGSEPRTSPLPFRNELNAAGTFFDPVRPFASFNQQNNISNSQDSGQDADGKIWSTQGWYGGRVETQQVAVDATAGAWRLTFSGQQTTNINSEAPATTVQTRLEALSNINPGDVTVAGAAGGPYTVTFRGPLAANVPAMTAQDISLSGGGDSVAVTTTQDGLYNHSRVYRFDPSATDSASTLQDDRFCAFNLPGNQEDVIGITTGGGKTWVMESGWGGLSPARLTWFNPSDPVFTTANYCNDANNLDFGTAAEPTAYPPGPAFNPGYCTSGTLNCYSTVTMPAALGAPGFLAYDAAENAIWTSTYTWGGPSSLGRYDVATNQWSVFPLPTSATYLPAWNPGTWGGSSTWEITLSGNYVYVTDMNDADLIRFDKTYAPRSNCAGLQNESQRVTINATSGNWTLSFLGQATANLDSEATAATVQSSLEALVNINPGDVTVTGAAGGPYTVAFAGPNVAKDVAQLLAVNVSLNSGATVGVTTTQQGGQNLCMSEVHLPSFGTWQPVVRGSKVYWTAYGPPGGGYGAEFSKEPYANDTSMFGYVDLNNWGAITTYTGLESLVAPERANVGPPTFSWFDVDQTSGKVAIGQPVRGQFLRLGCNGNCPP